MRREEIRCELNAIAQFKKFDIHRSQKGVITPANIRTVLREEGYTEEVIDDYVSEFMLLDANGDGKISITDAVAVVNKLLGRPSSNFREEAADVNGDGRITITDAVAIVNIVLGKRSANARVGEPQ